MGPRLLGPNPCSVHRPKEQWGPIFWVLILVAYTDQKNSGARLLLFWFVPSLRVHRYVHGRPSCPETLRESCAGMRKHILNVRTMSNATNVSNNI